MTYVTRSRSEVKCLVFRWLTLFRTRFRSLPIAGVGFAPGSDPFHVFGIAKVISVGGFAQPAPLTGGLAGAATLRRQAVKLALRVMRVGLEEKTAAAALVSFVLGTHRAPSRKKIQAPVQLQTSPPGRTGTKKEEQFSRWKREENQPEENGFSNRHFSTTFIPPLTDRAKFKNEFLNLRDTPLSNRILL